jgi:hypothetical protein
MKRTVSGRKKSRSNGSSRKSSAPQTQFAVCVRNDGYEASLELRKLYKVLPSKLGAEHKFIRIVDESGEDYLYPASFFAVVELPQNVRRALRLAS